MARIDLKHLIAAVGVLLLAFSGTAAFAKAAKRPNILIAISDDQGYPYTSAYGSPFVRTPSFDRVAANGAIFTHAFASSPGCSPSRAALLTGLNSWMTGAAGTHASNFPAIFTTIPEQLEKSGYHVGHTGKGWGPGRWEDERKANPAGPAYDKIKLKPPAKGISPVDYSANFAAFLDDRKGEPFFFWYGALEPHSPFDPGVGFADVWRTGRIVVPPFLANTATAQADLADYAYEIEWFDRHLGLMLDELERRGELDNTIVIVTSDNGMPFPRAKANLYDSGLRVPLAISWPSRTAKGNLFDQLVSLTDLAPTIYSATGVTPPYQMEGVNLLPLLRRNGTRVFTAREFVLAGRERHSSSRWNNQGYPARSIRTRDFLYIRNFRPERGPAGASTVLLDDGSRGPDRMAYFDIDRSRMQKELFERRNDPAFKRFFELAVGNRMERELYDLHRDPDQLNNVAYAPEYGQIADEMDRRLMDNLRRTHDIRVGPNPEQWEAYPRLDGVERRFPREK